MKHYKMYMDRQGISPAVHEKLMNLDAEPKATSRPWIKYGALAACAALIVGVGIWKLAPTPAPIQSGGQFAADYEPLPGEMDTVGPEDPGQGDSFQGVADFHGFVVNSPTESDKLMFPMIPAIAYPDQTDAPQMAASRAYAPGTFLVDLEKEDIQTIFWGPEGKPEAEHPKTEQGDLPWMLFWDGYTIVGYAWYDGQGQLTELTISGTKGRASFDLELRLGALPFTCCVDMNRGDEISEFNGVEVAGWSKVYDRDGDGQTDYICGSEFMTESDIGVRFENRNSQMQAEYNGSADMEFGGTCTFNALFVRQTLTSGLYLDHLAIAESVPEWREEEFSTLAQARQEGEFAPYLPTVEPAGYDEFYGRISYQEGHSNSLFVRWSKVLGYDDVEVVVYRDGYYPYDLADPNNPASYDVRLYDIPWCDSVPEEYRETVSDPAFRAEDMTLAIVEARGREKDTGGMRFNFDVLHPDGTVVSYNCDGLSAQQVWAMVEETLD